MSLKSVIHSLIDEMNVGNEVKERLHDEADVKEVPDTVPDEKPETEAE